MRGTNFTPRWAASDQKLKRGLKVHSRQFTQLIDDHWVSCRLTLPWDYFPLARHT